MPSKFGLAGFGLRYNLDAKRNNFYFGTEIQNGHHEIVVQKYELQAQLVIPTKFGLAGIGLRGNLDPKSKNFHFGMEIQDVQKYELQTQLVIPTKFGLAGIGLRGHLDFFKVSILYLADHAHQIWFDQDWSEW